MFRNTITCIRLSHVVRAPLLQLKLPSFKLKFWPYRVVSRACSKILLIPQHQLEKERAHKVYRAAKILLIIYIQVSDFFAPLKLIKKLDDGHYETFFFLRCSSKPASCRKYHVYRRRNKKEKVFASREKCSKDF